MSGPRHGRSFARRSVSIVPRATGAVAVVIAFLVAFMPTVAPRPLRIASLNVHRCAAGIHRVSEALRRPRADVVCLQETSEADAHAIANRLGLPHRHFAVRVARPVDGGAPWGCAILARHPLVDVGAIPRFAGKGTMGLWATFATREGPIRVANVHLAATYGLDPRHVVESNGWRAIELADLAEAHRRDGQPMLAIGDFNQPPVGANFDAMRAIGRDALADLGRGGATFRSGWVTTRIDYALTTVGLRAVAGGVGEDDGASDHRPIHVTVRRVRP